MPPPPECLLCSQLIFIDRYFLTVWYCSLVDSSGSGAFALKDYCIIYCCVSVITNMRGWFKGGWLNLIHGFRVFISCLFGPMYFDIVGSQGCDKGWCSLFLCGWGVGRRIMPALTWLSPPTPFILLRSQVHRMKLLIFMVVLPTLVNLSGNPVWTHPEVCFTSLRWFQISQVDEKNCPTVLSNYYTYFFNSYKYLDYIYDLYCENRIF